MFSWIGRSTELILTDLISSALKVSETRIAKEVAGREQHLYLLSCGDFLCIDLHSSRTLRRHCHASGTINLIVIIFYQG